MGEGPIRPWRDGPRSPEEYRGRVGCGWTVIVLEDCNGMNRSTTTVKRYSAGGVTGKRSTPSSLRGLVRLVPWNTHAPARSHAGD